MRRHHYDYMRETYLLESSVWQKVKSRFRIRAADLAVAELGLCDPNGPGSLTHPHLTRTLYADGKVVTPLFKNKPGTLVEDKRTGEFRLARADPTAALHVTGSGEEAYGNKFVLVACRLPGVHGRFILDVDWVEQTGGEARVATAAIAETADLLPGVQAVLYDGALRGVHMDDLLRNHGMLPVAPVQALSGGRRSRKPRVEREVLVETRVIDGRTIALYTQAGALGYVELDEVGDGVFLPLPLLKVARSRNRDGTYRWYGEYRLPPELGGHDLRVRFDITDEDRARGFNRTEHLRAIPPSSADYSRLYPRRSDSEAINRYLDDTLWLTRAHSVGGPRQLVDLLGFALLVNAVALHRARAARHA